MTSSTRDAVNRANALHSTGPRTIEGKQRAAMNALKHGLTGQRLILQPSEHEAWRALHEALHAELQPETTMELQLVQKIIDTHMRLNRIAVLDNNMLNFGLLENLEEPDQAGDTEIAKAQARSFTAQQLSFDKLGRYEGRLSRQLIAYTKELERLQAIRIKNEETQRWEGALESANRGVTSMSEVLARHRATKAAAQSVAQTQPAKSQDLPPQNPTAHENPRSLASFGSSPFAPGPASGRDPGNTPTPPPETPLAA